jgi:threonine-phosphate decarboxylase
MTWDLKKMVRRELLGMRRPVHGGLGWRYADMEDFSSNLNPLGAPEGIAEVMTAASRRLQHYPDDSCEDLRAAISEHLGVDKKCIIGGAGSAELIRLFAEVFVREGDKLVMPLPTFSEYSFGARMFGAKIVDHPLLEADGFDLDIGRMLPLLNTAKAVYVCNPNNPTGRLTPRKAILELLKECERKEVLLFLDETLQELIPDAKDYTCVNEVESWSNLFIIRSFTKCFAIPGLRLGYGVGSEPLVSYMDRARLSWNVGTVEASVGAFLFRERYAHVHHGARIMADEKERIVPELRRTHLFHLRTPDAFFFFTRITPSDISAADLIEFLVGRKLLIRDCSSFGKPFERHVRFAIKTRERNDMLLSALRDASEELRLWEER